MQLGSGAFTAHAIRCCFGSLGECEGLPQCEHSSQRLIEQRAQRETVGDAGHTR
jgi:hypothetical protein